MIAVAFCLLLAGGLIGGGIMLMDHLNQQNAPRNEGDGQTDTEDRRQDQRRGHGAKDRAVSPPAAVHPGISKYMFLNPLTAHQRAATDRSKPAAKRWPTSGTSPATRNNNQLFVLSDTTAE